MKRSMAFSMWPACLAAVGGTLIAPVLIPFIWGNVYQSAVIPLQIAIWMVPVAWFSGHFRFSLIAAGLQRWEFAASAGTAVVTVTSAAILGHYHGSVGAASALLAGGIANTILAIAASNRYIGRVDVAASVTPAVMATGVSLAVGAGVKIIAGTLLGTIVACVVYLIMAARNENELVRMVRGWRGR
jgi:O-antigen/teichoic acid export membrane protein